MNNIPAETDDPPKSSPDPDGTEDVNLGYFLKAFFHLVPAILYIKDELGRYVKINRHCEETFQVTDQQVRGTTDHDHCPVEFADQYRRNVIAHPGRPLGNHCSGWFFRGGSVRRFQVLDPGHRAF